MGNSLPTLPLAIPWLLTIAADGVIADGHFHCTCPFDHTKSRGGTILPKTWHNKWLLDVAPDWHLRLLTTAAEGTAAYNQIG